jgi:hypothetical protein
MDPQATLRLIEESETKQDTVAACQDLSSWLGRGGFEPDWSLSPRGRARYNAWARGDERYAGIEATGN